MGELKEELDSKVTLDNLCSPEIVELSQKLDKKVVEAQRIIFDIANLTKEQVIQIATRASNTTLERMDNKEGCLIEILQEEKELSHYLTDQSIDNDINKTIDTIITDENYLDNKWDYIKEH